VGQMATRGQARQALAATPQNRLRPDGALNPGWPRKPRMAASRPPRHRNTVALKTPQPSRTRPAPVPHPSRSRQQSGTTGGRAAP
jgi:hypothetical protein